MQKRLQRGSIDLVVDAKGALAVTPLPAGAAGREVSGARAPDALVARAFVTRVAPAWRISSFSGLVARNQDESPDYDSIRSVQRVEVVPRQAGGDDAFGLPRGVRLGTALHKVFETLDFASADEARIAAVVRRELTQSGIDDSWTEVSARTVSDVLATPLDMSGFALRDLARPDCVDELEFTYPVRGAAASELATVLAPLRAIGSRLPEAIGSLVLAPARGFMRGYIDLVFARDGRYFIVDYKSNWLGDTMAHYAPERLAVAMAESFYDLQYLVYAVALHRLLATRVEDYEYERHFGGIHYLFLRAMRPATGAAFGVYSVRPDASLVKALDACLAPGEPLLRDGSDGVKPAALPLLPAEFARVVGGLVPDAGEVPRLAVALAAAATAAGHVCVDLAAVGGTTALDGAVEVPPLDTLLASCRGVRSSPSPGALPRWCSMDNGSICIATGNTNRRLLGLCSLAVRSTMNRWTRHG